ncbi:M20/M25/M40 family metallo-hydrolase [Rarobacter incanus]|uniref:Glutamate carboxypeptidase n=1 Tax=Rarobacter incanus TaxID=153494 RepID=A0A542SNE0_9MICO|nr:M20/M25/M40 family metallo-hydrolase [Rarobacter incanus]TQK76149.1 glutamate carboxypeptidase [Rarobacter incanus]
MPIDNQLRADCADAGRVLILPRAEDMVDRLEDLVRIETPSGDRGASALIADVLARWFGSIGAAVRLVESEQGTNLIADWGGRGGENPVLLVGHTDTVWPVGALAEQVPWRVEGDRVSGPGVLDMKSGIVIMFQAMAMIARMDHRAVRVILVCDEEIGSPSSAGLLRETARDAACAVGFECPHPDGALKVGRRGSTRVRLSVAGVPAHAALDPDKGVSAIDEIIDQLAHVRTIAAGAGGGSSEVLCNIGTLAGGTRANVIAAHAEAEIGFRFVDAETERAVLDAVGNLHAVRPGAHVEVEVLSHRPAWKASEQDLRLMSDLAISAHEAGLELGGRPAAGAGDANNLGAMGVATVDGFGPHGAGAHAAGEHASARSMAERALALATYLTRTAAATS